MAETIEDEYGAKQISTRLKQFADDKGVNPAEVVSIKLRWEFADGDEKFRQEYHGSGPYEAARSEFDVSVSDHIGGGTIPTTIGGIDVYWCEHESGPEIVLWIGAIGGLLSIPASICAILTFYNQYLRKQTDEENKGSTTVVRRRKTKIELRRQEGENVVWEHLAENEVTEEYTKVAIPKLD